MSRHKKTSGGQAIVMVTLALFAMCGMMGLAVDLDVDYTYRMVRSYRISTERIQRHLGFATRVSVEDSIGRMVSEIRRRGLTDFSHPRYYNIEWMKLMEESVDIVSRHGYVLSKPGWESRREGSDEGVTQLRSSAARPRR